jgi:uncharacterized protein YPO0396
MDAVDQVLSPEHQSAALIADEVRALERRLAAALEEISTFEKEEYDESERIALEKDIAERSQELDSLKKRVKAEVEVVRALKAERTQLTEQNSRMQAELEEAADLEAILQREEEQLSQKQAEFRLKKKNFEEEEQLLAALHAQPAVEPDRTL